MRPAEAIDACITAPDRLLKAIDALTDEDVAQPSSLPGWSRGHVLTHLAHKTVTHVWLFDGAQANEVRDHYPHGFARAQADVDAGAGRSAAELRTELIDSFADLEVAWAKLPDSYWDWEGICVPGPRSMRQIVGRHLRDVEVHDVDLDIGYRPTDWPEVFVESELAKRPQSCTCAIAISAVLCARRGARTSAVRGGRRAVATGRLGRVECQSVRIAAQTAVTICTHVHVAVDDDAGSPPALLAALTHPSSPGARLRGSLVPTHCSEAPTAKEPTVTVSPEPRALDHRDINRDVAVFTTDPFVGPGLPLWLPAGAAIRHELELFAAEIARDDGCMPVYSPVLAKRALFETSGHWAKFSDDMFPPMRIGGDEFVLRPANCPHHAVIYAAQQRSYRELPIRLNELAPMFRAERSGVLSGLSRVRQISLDDTHVFCRPDQVADEVQRALRSALKAQRVLGLPVDHVRLSRRDTSDHYLGSAEQWQHAEDALRVAGRSVLAELDLPLVEAEGEAAFYGPKLDLQVHDGRGHEETIGTVQLDFSQPDRFDLAYTAADGSRQRVVMIHRGTVGAMERVVAALLERYQGRLPLWLAPVQLTVLPVGPEHDASAHALLDDVRAAGLRAVVEVEGSLGARIRASRQRRDCVIAVIGDAEVASGVVQVIDVAADFRGSIARSDLVELLSRSYTNRDRIIAWARR